MQVKVEKLYASAQLPVYGSAGAACFDLYAHNDRGDGVFGTGLAFEVPEGHVMLIYSRSGHGFKHGIRLANCVGVIDSDYRGEVVVKLHHDRGGFLPLLCGERIAQAMIVPVDRVTFVESDELSGTERGAGGFGSTGK